MLHALAACLTAGLANIAAARGVNLTEVESTVEGDIDLLGILGLSDEVRNGYQQIKVSFKLRGDDPEKLRQVVEQSRKRSAVYDVVTNGVPVTDRRRRRLIGIQRRDRPRSEKRNVHASQPRSLRRGDRRRPRRRRRHSDAARPRRPAPSWSSTAAATAPTPSPRTP